MEMKLYVGNLSSETTEDDLLSLFTQVGKVNEVALHKDPDRSSSRRYAYVTMNSQDEANKAIYVFNGRNLDNHELKVNAVRPNDSNYDINQGSRYQSNRTQTRSGGSKRY